ncbi:MAG: carbohydrate ABC transporter permease [Clostridiales bacterium]|nr:carbohydrate ABC transporter permease [Clostridiales bacterium]
MKSKEHRITQVIAHLFCGIAALMALLPFILLIIASFTDNEWAELNGYSYFPQALSLEAYKYILASLDTIGRAYLMTIIVTAVGTFLSIIITSLFAWALCRDGLPGIKLVNFMLVLTLLFNGGIVANYYIYANVYHIRNTIWALIIPSLLMNAFNVILMKNYYKNSIPAALLEAARIDGGGELYIFFKVVMPLSIPILATIGLMTGLMYWNDWMNGLYYLTPREGSRFYTIQIVLNNINENVQALASSASSLGVSVTELPSTTIRMAIATVGILPILVIYPFFQKYFVRGITLGSVKE